MIDKTRRGWLALALVSLAAATLSACSGGTTKDDSTSDGPVTLTWNVNASSTDVYKQIAAAFEKANPTIKINLTVKSSNTDTNRAAIINAIGGGSETPDVYFADVVWTAQFGKNNLAADLTGKLSKETLDSVSPEVLKTGQYKGKQYCMPVFTDAGVLYYRKDLLDAAKLDVPTTWEQLATEAKQLQDDGKVKNGFVYRGAPYEGTTVFWTELMADAGGSSVNKAYTKSTVDSEAGKTALNFLKDTIKSGISPAAVSTFKEPEALNVFSAGDAAFMSSNAYMYGASQDPKQSSIVGKVGIAPMPTFEGQEGPGYSGSGGGNECINPNSKHLAEGIKLIEFVNAKAQQELIASVGKLVSASTEVQQDPAMAQVNAILPLIKQLKIVNRPAETSAYAEVSRDIFTNINAALSGGSTGDALSAMHEQIGAALKGVQ